MLRVFISGPELAGGQVTLAAEAARHLGGALRVRPGEEIVAVTPDAVEHRCRVLRSSPREVVAEVLGSRVSTAEPSRHVRVCQALLKGDQLERIMEYGSELGVASFQAMITERTVARPEPSRLAQRLERWRGICRQGAELGQRGRAPEVLPVTDLRGAVGAARDAGLACFLLFEGAGLPSLSARMTSAGGCCLLAGPEGGWSESEVMLARQAGAEPVSLGPRIMRPLPAVMAAVAIALDRSHDLELKES